MELKERQGLTISAVLPTLDEAATIGPIVRMARKALMEDVPLIDELLVIDSEFDRRHAFDRRVGGCSRGQSPADPAAVRLV